MQYVGSNTNVLQRKMTANSADKLYFKVLFTKQRMGNITLPPSRILVFTDNKGSQYYNLKNVKLPTIDGLSIEDWVFSLVSRGCIKGFVYYSSPTVVQGLPVFRRTYITEAEQRKLLSTNRAVALR